MLEHFEGKFFRDLQMSHGTMAAYLHVVLELNGIAICCSLANWPNELVAQFSKLALSKKQKDQVKARVFIQCLPNLKEMELALQQTESDEVFESVAQIMTLHCNMHQFEEDTAEMRQETLALRQMIKQKRF